MSTELQEAPPVAPTEQAENDALKANFNSAVAKETGIDPATTTDDTPDPALKPTLVPVKETKVDTKTEESIVPEQFTGKPAEKKEEPTDEIPVNAGTKQLRDVLARRDAKLKEFQVQVEDLRKKLETAPVSQSKEHEDMVRVANERAAKLEAELERAAYNRSPKFQRFESEHTAELTSAKSYLEGTDVSPTILEVAANQTGQARLKTLRDAGLDAETIAAVGPHLARADAIRRERDASLDNWKQSMTAEQEQSKAQQAHQEQQRQAQEQAVLKQVADEMTKNNPAFTKVDGHEKWNAMVDQNFKDAEDFAMGRKPLKELFELGYHGIGAKTMKLMNDELTKKCNSLTEQVSRLTAAQPGTGRSVDLKTITNGQPVNEVEEYKASFNREIAAVTGR